MNTAEAVLALRFNIEPPPSSSSIYGCVRSGTLGPFPMVCASLVAQYQEHCAETREHHIAALHPPVTDTTAGTLVGPGIAGQALLVTR
jgi:hypothetical protein